MTGTASPRVAPSRAEADRHPERWLWGVAAAAAGVLLVQALVAWSAGHPGHGSEGVLPHALGWLAMIAVMAPLVAANARYAAMCSPRAARTGVTIDVVAGWAAAWGVAAVVLGVGAWLLGRRAGDLGAVVLVTAVAVGWQYSPGKRRSSARCHRVFAPPLDRRRARRACSWFGFRLGRSCVSSCWPLMALMAVAGHSPLVVAASVGVAWYERRQPHHDPATTETALLVAAIGATAVVAAVQR